MDGGWAKSKIYRFTMLSNDWQDRSTVVRTAGIPAQLGTLPSVAKTFAVPQGSPPMRLPSFPAVERTSVLGFNATTTATVGSGAYNAGFLSRQAMFPLWQSRVLTGNYYLCYTPPMISTSPVATTPTGWPLTKAAVGGGTIPGFNVPGQSLAGSIPADVMVNGNTLEPGYPWLGIDQEATGQYWYVPRGWMMGISIGGVFDQGLFGYPGRFVLDRFTSAGEWVPLALAATGEFTVLNGSVPEGEKLLNGFWYYLGIPDEDANVWLRLRCFALNSSASGNQLGECLAAPLFVAVAPTVSFEIQHLSQSGEGWGVTTPWINRVSCGGSLLALAPMLTTTAFNTSAVPFLNTRLTAVSALFTNVTKVLNKEGTTLAARFNPEQVDIFNVGSKFYQDVHPSEKFFYGLEKGFYTYCPPSTDLAKFWDYTISAASLVLPIYRLDNTAMVNSWVFSDPDGGTSLAVNLDWHIEFRNSSQLWPIAMSGLTLETLHTSQLALAAAGFFFDNLDHKWILGKVAAAANFFRPITDLTPAGKLVNHVIDEANRRWGQRERLNVAPRNPIGQPTTTTLAVAPLRAKKVMVAKPKAKTAKPKAKKKK